MQLRQFILKNLGLVILLAVVTSACMRSSHDDHGHGHGHGHAEDHSNEFERGKHGGRLLRDKSFVLELQIFETGVPPQYRIYGYEHGKKLKPEEFTATVELNRLGKATEIFEFEPVGDFLASKKEVSEPHSFDVIVKAASNGKSHKWNFASYEGRTVIPDDVAKLSGLVTEKTASREIATTTRIRGKITPSEHKIAHVIPRFSGVVREGRKHIGDTVKKGEVLAVIESNESLQPFEVRSQIDGTVISGHVVVGEFVPENQWIYIVADLSEVWADFFVPLREDLSVKIGQKIKISTVSRDWSVDGVISYVAPYADEKSQSQMLRVVIANEHNKFLPGMFVLGDLVVDEQKVPVAVKKVAMQKFRDWDVVFRKVKETYEIAPLELGKSDGEWAEVISGISAGDEYVTENAFLIKADILKSGASHDH